MKFWYLVLIWLLYGTNTNVFAQESFLDRFTASEIKGKVFLDWVITAGSTCQGIRILRSTDSINFIQIGDIGGVCGNISTPQGYNFTDDNPVKNKINYYRLELGGIGLSKILAVEIIDLEIGGYQVRPNPITSDARIYFDNSIKGDLQLRVFNLSGAEVYAAHRMSNYFYIPNGEIPTGTYTFTISTPGVLPIIKGKFLAVN